MKHAKRHYRAHRVAYELAAGVPPGRLLVCHHCDNPPCVNPAHLFLGTASDNASDMVAKGRHTAKLSSADARAIREERARGGAGYQELALRYGVSDTVIYNIVRGISYRP